MKKSIFLFFAALLCAIGMNAATPTKIYLNAKDWGYSDARYAAYFFDPAKWVDMTKVDGETYIYEVDVPSGYTKVIFCRMNGSKTDNKWDNKWNQSGDLTIPTDGKNMFKPDDWDGSTKTWSTYTPKVTHTFAKNSTLYIDFRAITDASKKGANYPKAGTASGLDYSANAGGTVIPVTFTADVKWAEGAEFMKTDKGGWASIPFKAPEAGQNCAQVAADGKSYTWTTYSEPSVTLSLNKESADAGTEVTVTLTAVADNVAGEVTYTFQYSTDNATWNNISSTGNTATQTFAAETRYYKVTMTNGGNTKEATAKFSAITFHVIGSWDDWAAHNEVVEGSKTITLEANKTYDYKITNGTWDLSWGNDGTMDRNNCTDWSFESNNNAKIKTDEAGDYVFNVSRNAEGKVVVSVTYPELSAPIPTFDYYIVGSFNGDDPKKAENGMTLDGTVYKATVTLAAGDNTLKVTDGTWDKTWGANELGADYEEVSNPNDGYNNIKITLTAEKTIAVIFDATGEGKITFEGLTEVTYSDITIKAYTEGSAPQIWWWNGGSKCPDADKTNNPSNPGNKYTWETAPTMTAVAGEANWYEYTFKDVNDYTGICFKFKSGDKSSSNFEGVKEDKCYDVRDIVNAKTTECGVTPSDCIECSGIYLKGTFNSWGTEHEFMKTADANVVTTTVTITQEGNYNFKVHATDWLGNDGGTMARGGSGVETGGWTMEKDKNEVTLAADMEGDYIFTYTISTKKLTITFPVVVPQSFPNQPTTLYFHPSSNWKKGNERYAAYIYNNGADKEWINLTDANSDGIYELANPQKYAKVIICRMDKTKAENKWENKWDQIESGIEIPNTATLNTCLAFWTNCEANVPVSECTWVAPTPLTDANWSAFVAAYNGKTINAVVERSFKSGQYHTLCLPFDIPTNWLGEGTKAYQLTSIVANESDKLSLNATLWNTIVAGQPYIIVPVKGDEYEHVIINGVTVKNVSAGTNEASGDGYKATLKAVTATGGKTNGTTEYYVGANDGFLYNAVVDKLGLRAIIELTTTSGQPLPAKVRAYVAAEENEATGLDNIQLPNANSQKLIINGQLIIIRGNEKFNAQGVRL